MFNMKEFNNFGLGAPMAQVQELSYSRITRNPPRSHSSEVIAASEGLKETYLKETFLRPDKDSRDETARSFGKRQKPRQYFPA